MIQYRYQLEKYRGRSTRHVCPQCGRKSVFTRYIDTENNNIYISDIVGKCNRLDKCGYHYTPHQYFTDNPWKRDNSPREEKFSFFQKHRENEKMKIETPPPHKRRTLTIATSLSSLLSLTSLKKQSSFRLHSALFYIQHPISPDKRFDIMR